MIKKLNLLKKEVTVIKSNADLLVKKRKLDQKIGLDLIVVPSFSNDADKTIFSGSAVGGIIKKRYSVLGDPLSEKYLIL